MACQASLFSFVSGGLLGALLGIALFAGMELACPLFPLYLTRGKSGCRLTRFFCEDFYELCTLEMEGRDGIS